MAKFEGVAAVPSAIRSRDPGRVTRGPQELRLIDISNCAMPPSDQPVESPETIELLTRAAEGEEQVWGELLARHEGRLRRMVAMRMDPRIQQRLSASDVLQDAYLEAARHLPEYLSDPKAPFFLWLRGIAANKLLHLHRYHLGAEKRDPRREVRRARQPETQSVTLAGMLAGDATRPSDAALRDELYGQLHEAIERLDPIDREVLSLRHFEQLSNAETAEVLQIEPSAASKRYMRALERLKSVLSVDHPSLRGK